MILPASIILYPPNGLPYTSIINNRTYASPAGGPLTVPYFDSTALEANGWSTTNPIASSGAVTSGFSGVEPYSAPSIAAIGDGITSINNSYSSYSSTGVSPAPGPTVTLGGEGYLNWACALTNQNVRQNPQGGVFGFALQTTATILKYGVPLVLGMGNKPSVCCVQGGTNDLLLDATQGSLTGTLASTAALAAPIIANLTLMYTQLIAASILVIAIPITPRSDTAMVTQAATMSQLSAVGNPNNITAAQAQSLQSSVQRYVNRWMHRYSSLLSGMYVADANSYLAQNGDTNLINTQLMFMRDDLLTPNATGGFFQGLAIANVLNVLFPLQNNYLASNNSFLNLANEGTGASYAGTNDNRYDNLLQNAMFNQVVTATFSGIPAAADTLTIAGQVFTFQTGVPTGIGQVQIGTTLALTLSNIANAINNVPYSATVYGYFPPSSAFGNSVSASVGVLGTSITINSQNGGAGAGAFAVSRSSTVITLGPTTGSNNSATAMASGGTASLVPVAWNASTSVAAANAIQMSSVQSARYPKTTLTQIQSLGVATYANGQAAVGLNQSYANNPLGAYIRLYQTVTAASAGLGCAWQALTAFGTSNTTGIGTFTAGSLCYSNSNVYTLISGTSPAISGTVGPSGTATSGIVDGNLVWGYVRPDTRTVQGVSDTIEGYLYVEVPYNAAITQNNVTFMSPCMQLRDGGSTSLYAAAMYPNFGALAVPATAGNYYSFTIWTSPYTLSPLNASSFNVYVYIAFAQTLNLPATPALWGVVQLGIPTLQRVV